MSQKPFGFFGISAPPWRSWQVLNSGQASHKSLSASLAFLPHWWGWLCESLEEGSQKPFGFFGISAFGGLTVMLFEIPGHKSLSASLAFLPPGPPEHGKIVPLGHKSLSASLAFLHIEE